LRGAFTAPQEIREIFASDQPSGRIGMGVDKLLRHPGCAVEYRHFEAVVGHIERQVLAHHGQTDQPDISASFFRHGLFL
jgi:hypothetical protein